MKIEVLGVGIDALTKNELLGKLKNLLTAGKSIFIVTPYSESIVAAQKDGEFREILNSADFALPDGIGILWAAHFLHTPSPGDGEGQGRGRTILKLVSSLLAIIFNPKSIRHPIPEKISGTEFVWDLAELAAQNNYSVFLLGGFGDTPRLAANVLKKKFPNLKIAVYNAPQPPLKVRGGEGELSEAVDQINSSHTDFLFVALGPMRQEKWIYQNLPKLRVKLAMGLGGTFDYLAQKRPYRPKIWALAGLEWLWRLLTQPWRVVRIFKGVLGSIWYSLKARLTSRQI